MIKNALEIAGEQAAEFAKNFDSWGPYIQQKGFTFKPSIKSESGGDILIGDESYETLKPVIYSLYTEKKLQRVISFNALRDLALELFGKMLHKKVDVEFTDAEFTRHLNEIVESKLSNHTVIVPCNITLAGKSYIEIPFGPVTLMNRPKFEELLNSQRGNLKFQGYQDIWDETEGYYKKFHWFAHVETPPVFDYDAAKKLATTAALHALNLLHLFISVTHSNRMNAGFHISPSADEYHIFSADDGNFTFQKNHSFVGGNIGIPGDFWSMLLGGNLNDWRGVQAACIEQFLNPSKSFPAANRLLDSSYWVGDAVRESSIAMKVVKYVFGIERAVMFKSDRGGKKDIFANRATTLLSYGGFVSEEEEGLARMDFRTMYQIRSNLAHGSVSPTINELSLPLIRIDELARNTILSFMRLMGSHLNSFKVDKALKEWFNEYTSPSVKGNTGDSH